jgi:LmbE family N-acetylglucosaminyl deacetylase
MNAVQPRRGPTVALAIVAHPDDETICAGGALALLASRGVDVTVACSTRGEGGVTGDPPLCRAEDLGERREAELRQAAGLLGARSVVFLGYVDPPVAPGNLPQAAATDLTEYAGRVLNLLRSLEPDIVITHGSNGEYGHPQHVITHQAVMAAWRRWRNEAPGRAEGAALYTFAAACPPADAFSFFRNPSDAPTTTVDISTVLQRKAEAFAAHATQVATTLKDAGLLSTENMFPAREYFRRWSGPLLLEAILHTGATWPVAAHAKGRGSVAKHRCAGCTGCTG